MTSASSRLARMNLRYAVARAPQVGDRIDGLWQLPQLTAELSETLEVELADYPRLVAEQLVEGRGRGGGTGGQGPRREPSRSFLGQQFDGGENDPIP